MTTKKKVVKERLINSGTFTEAEFKSFIISALRNLTRFWKPKAEALRDARVGRGLYKCSNCGIIGPLTLPPPKGKKRKIKNMLVDHTIPIVGIEGFTSYDDWIRRCFVEREGLQVLCANCHSGIEGKTQKENKERTEYKKKQYGLQKN